MPYTAAIIELKMAQRAKHDQVGATVYSCVRSLRHLLIGRHSVCLFPRTSGVETWRGGLE